MAQIDKVTWDTDTKTVVVVKKRNQDKANLPIILAVIASFLILILAFTYYADVESEQITIFSQFGDFFEALGSYFANLVN